jgi:hypothetical protein
MLPLVRLGKCHLALLLTKRFQEFHRHRNFFSFTAVISGMKASQSQAYAEQQHGSCEIYRI